MNGTASGPAGESTRGMRIRMLSFSISAIGCLLILLLGFNRFLMDGSFWIDESSVAESLTELQPHELFGRLRYGISFPRFYLLVFAALDEWVGYETWVLRLPAFFFFALATGLWMRLFYLRFRTLPLLIAVAILLNFFPTTWFIYSSLLKQYTFDVFLALLIFSVPDESLDSLLRRGRRPALALLLTLPCALSYTYVFVLMGRCAGWLLTEAGRGRYRIAPRSLIFFSAGLLVFNASLYLTDVRHTLEMGSLSNYWRSCLIGAEGVATLPLLDETFFGWYDGRTAFNHSRGMHPVLLHLFRIFFVLGVARISMQLVMSFRSGSSEDFFRTPWGSRSLGCLCSIAIFLVGSVLLGYPVCATRLILFLLFAMQIVTLEGLDAIGVGLRRLPRGSLLAMLFLGGLLVSMLPDASRDYREHLSSRPPQDLRPYLARIGPDNELPIMVDACSSRQLLSLPEGVGDAEIIRYLRRGRMDMPDHIPYGEEAWVLNVTSPCLPFGNPSGVLRNYATRFDVVMGLPGQVRLYRAKFRERE